MGVRLRSRVCVKHKKKATKKERTCVRCAGFCAVFRGAWGCRRAEVHYAFARRGHGMFGGLLVFSLSLSRRYLHIKTSMWEMLAHRVYSAHKGVFYCELPLIITGSPRRDPLGGGPGLPRPSLRHSPFVVVAVAVLAAGKSAAAAAATAAVAAIHPDKLLLCLFVFSPQCVLVS